MYILYTDALCIVLDKYRTICPLGLYKTVQVLFVPPPYVLLYLPESQLKYLSHSSNSCFTSPLSYYSLLNSILWSLYTFLVSIITSLHIFTCEDLELGTTDEREHVFLGLVTSLDTIFSSSIHLHGHGMISVFFIHEEYYCVYAPHFDYLFTWLRIFVFPFPGHHK